MAVDLYIQYILCQIFDSSRLFHEFNQNKNKNYFTRVDKKDKLRRTYQKVKT